jgi:hypothetical protein
LCSNLTTLFETIDDALGSSVLFRNNGTASVFTPSIAAGRLAPI